LRARRFPKKGLEFGRRSSNVSKFKSLNLNVSKIEYPKAP
jgi:hypothetical protein